MGASLFLGYALIAGGPCLVIYCAFISGKAFLSLLTLGSMFLWLTTLLMTSLLLRGLVGADSWPWGPAVALTLAVSIQEVVRYAIWRANSKLEAALDGLARSRNDVGLSSGERLLIALTHGLAHGAAHSLFFYFSWLPLTLDEGTYYVDACPAMSYFLAMALCSLAFFLLHTFSMVVAFLALDTQHMERHALVASVHLAASLLTLGNLIHDGCLVIIPLLLIIAVAVTAFAAWLAYGHQQASWRVGFEPLPSNDETS